MNAYSPKIEEIVSLGVPRDVAPHALKIFKWDVNLAVNAYYDGQFKDFKPTQENRILEIVVVRLKELPIRLKFEYKVLCDKSFSFLKKYIASILGIVNPETLIFGELFNKKIYELKIDDSYPVKNVKIHDELYVFELSECYRTKHIRIQGIKRLIVHVAELRFFLLLPKEYPDGRQVLVRRRITSFPFLINIDPKRTTGRDIYEKSMKILQRYMVPKNAREVLMENTEEKMDLWDFSTLFKKVDDEKIKKWRSENKEIRGSEVVKEDPRGSFVEGKIPVDDTVDWNTLLDPFLLIEYYTENDSKTRVSDLDKSTLHYHNEQIIKRSDTLYSERGDGPPFGYPPNSMVPMKSIDTHESEGPHPLIHYRINVRFHQKFVLGLFDEEKLGEENEVTEIPRIFSSKSITTFLDVDSDERKMYLSDFEEHQNTFSDASVTVFQVGWLGVVDGNVKKMKFLKIFFL